MKFENAAIVMTDTDTGKAYARQLSAWELNLVLSQLQALDGGALKAQEIAPFVLHSVGVSPQQAQRIAEKQAGLQQAARQGVKGFEDMANAARFITQSGTLHIDLQRMANEPPEITPIDAALVDAARMTRQKHCPHETVLAGVCIVCDKRVKP